MKTSSVEERFWRFVDKSGDCWIWTGVPWKGYGKFRISPKTKVYVHRYSYELIIGKIPNGLTLDHLCRNTLCVNPAHLEPVTHQVNVLRGMGPTALNAAKTHCIRGHKFDEQNTYMHFSGRYCRECKREYQREWARNKRAHLKLSISPSA